ncbi:adenylate cyclase [Paraburkholderia phytofirmans OLGA172]|uniref:Adenylate cyclase n=1 Tax=Paraburkholderia phytofirmans OLGA172 TaxID=1417228 RepID=A0A167VWD3_9BURK|nr:class IV adenylate cyclase [Paraburkholderia phytofirmans]ANB72207.1 adenylate cyclase [Paraburkholderia phytofirmans OLGA172]
MARNIEIRARTDSFEELMHRAAVLALDTPRSYRQQDFFYDVPNGRLMLREFDDGTPAELAFYQSGDRDGSTVTYFSRSPVTNAEAMHTLLAQALTTRGIVSKERHVFQVGQMNLNLDRVDDLGDFVELEVPLTQDDVEAIGEADARAVFEKLGVVHADLVSVPYVDLLNAPRSNDRPSVKNA